ncbi:hypothetical protein OROHE_019732 [Orobanche hederae]
MSSGQFNRRKGKAIIGIPRRERGGTSGSTPTHTPSSNSIPIPNFGDYVPNELTEEQINEIFEASKSIHEDDEQEQPTKPKQRKLSKLKSPLFRSITQEWMHNSIPSPNFGDYVPDELTEEQINEIFEASKSIHEDDEQEQPTKPKQRKRFELKSPLFALHYTKWTTLHPVLEHGGLLQWVRAGRHRAAVRGDGVQLRVVGDRVRSAGGGGDMDSVAVQEFNRTLFSMRTDIIPDGIYVRPKAFPGARDSLQCHATSSRAPTTWPCPWRWWSISTKTSGGSRGGPNGGPPVAAKRAGAHYPGDSATYTI